MKTCSKCGIERDESNYSYMATGKNKLCPWCKECASEYSREYRKQHKESIKAQNQAYYNANKEMIIEYQSKYRSNNVEKCKERHAAYYNGHIEHHKLMSINWRIENKEQKAQYDAEWQRTHKDAVKRRNVKWKLNNKVARNAARRKRYESNKIHIREYANEWKRLHPYTSTKHSQIRRARKANVAYTLTPDQWNNIVGTFKGECCYCGENTKLTQDHFIALSLGGEWGINNIVPACVCCNSSKHNKDFFEWYPKHKHFSTSRLKLILKYLNYTGETQQIQMNLGG